MKGGIRPMTTPHDRIRDWLRGLGEEHGFEAWTEKTEVSEVGNARVEFEPDVTWISKNGEKVFFELLDKGRHIRLIVGEMFLACQVKDFSRMVFIKLTRRESYYVPVQNFLKFAFGKEGIVEIDYSPIFMILSRDLEEEEMKERIAQRLRSEQLIK